MSMGGWQRGYVADIGVNTNKQRSEFGETEYRNDTHGIVKDLAWARVDGVDCRSQSWPRRHASRIHKYGKNHSPVCLMCVARTTCHTHCGCMPTRSLAMSRASDAFDPWPPKLPLPLLTPRLHQPPLPPLKEAQCIS